MRAGRLRHRVTIQRKTVTKDTYGEEVIVWTDVATVWGAIEPIRGQELTELGREGAQVTTRVVIRYWPGLDPEQRVVEGAHVYDVLSVINVDERDREVQLMCRELV